MSRDVGGWAVPSSQSKNEDRAGLQQPALTGLADSPGGIAHNYTILQFVLEFSHAISFCTRLSSDLQFRLWTSRRGLNSCNALWAVGSSSMQIQWQAFAGSSIHSQYRYIHTCLIYYTILVFYYFKKFFGLSRL